MNLTIINSTQIKDEENNPIALEYSILENYHDATDSNAIRFGVGVVKKDEGRKQLESVIINNISHDRSFICDMIEKMYKGIVFPTNAEDVVRDLSIDEVAKTLTISYQVEYL